MRLYSAAQLDHSIVAAARCTVPPPGDERSRPRGIQPGASIDTVSSSGDHTISSVTSKP